MLINYSAPVCSTGYGIAGYNILKNLIQLGHNVGFFPIGDPEPEMGQEFYNQWYGSENFDRGNDYHITSLRIWHQYDVHPRIGDGMHFGFPIFELNKFSKLEVNSMRLCDHIIVCSEWAKSIVKSHLNKNVSVVPLGINPDIFKPAPLSHFEKTVFLNVGKWEIRKSHDFIIDCFSKAFEYKDDVELWMLCDNPFLEDRGAHWIQKCKNSKLGSKIKIIPRQTTHENVYNIMSRADVGLFPARAEGWNLELLEMMAIGKHVIASNYSAHTEFCDNKNSLLFDIDELELANDGIWFKNNGFWAHLGKQQEDQFIEYLRYTHKLKQEKKLGINTAGIDTGRKYTWENSARELIKALE